jgi:hypothetical protein
MTPTPIVIDYIALAPAEARARKLDPKTSHDAAKRVELGKAAIQRAWIFDQITRIGPLTVEELSHSVHKQHELGKRVNEVRGIEPTGSTRNGFRVWGLI